MQKSRVLIVDDEPLARSRLRQQIDTLADYEVVGEAPDGLRAIEMVASSTGRRPDLIVGKPYQPIIEAILEKVGFDPSQIAMVGDRLYTDIALGKAGIHTILVLSGEARVEDIPAAPVKPDYVFENVGKLYSLLRN